MSKKQIVQIDPFWIQFINTRRAKDPVKYEIETMSFADQSVVTVLQALERVFEEHGLESPFAIQLPRKGNKDRG